MGSINWLGDLTNWLKEQFLWLVHAIGELLTQLCVTALQAVCDFFVAIFHAIPVPDFLSNYSMSGILGNTGSDIGWLLVHMRIGEGLGLIAAGYGFRLLRKLLTLGQW